LFESRAKRKIVAYFARPQEERFGKHGFAPSPKTNITRAATIAVAAADVATYEGG